MSATIDILIERVVSRLGELGRSERDVSIEATGKPDAIRYIRMRRAMPSAERLQQLAGSLETTPDWLLGKDEVEARPSASRSHSGIASRQPDIPLTRSAHEGETAEIIQLDLSLPMGPGAEIDDYIEQMIVHIDMGLLRGLTRSPFHRLRLLKGIGDSMEPGLKNGDLVLIDTTYNRLDFEDKIWAVRIRGLGAVKRLRSAPKGKIKVISDNPGIPNDTVDADDIAILGRVVGAIRAM